MRSSRIWQHISKRHTTITINQLITPSTMRVPKLRLTVYQSSRDNDFGACRRQPLALLCLNSSLPNLHAWHLDHQNKFRVDLGCYDARKATHDLKHVLSVSMQNIHWRKQNGRASQVEDDANFALWIRLQVGLHASIVQNTRCVKYQLCMQRAGLIKIKLLLCMSVRVGCKLQSTLMLVG